MKSRSNLFLGILSIAFALILIAVWIPLDTDTGIVEKVRGRFAIGDALAPTVAACFVLFGGILLLAFERRAGKQAALDKSHITFMARLLAVLVFGVLVMRYTGPALAEFANLFRSEPVEFRLLRATIGWKHVGFVFGGVIMIAGIVSIVEQQISRRAVLTGVIAVAVMIMIFDVPFEDLLLPPNGDV